jgi:hypothetical protein
MISSQKGIKYGIVILNTMPHSALLASGLDVCDLLCVFRVEAVIF